jgi:hypothetical protein
MAERADQDYLNYNPFDGDRDVSIECYQVKIVTTRSLHWCSLSTLVGDSHDIAPGQRARKETAKVEGQFGSCYQCLPCMDNVMAQVGL